MAALILTPILIVLAVGLFYYPFRLCLELSVDGSLPLPLTAVSRHALVEGAGIAIKQDGSGHNSFTLHVLAF